MNLPTCAWSCPYPRACWLVEIIMVLILLLRVFLLSVVIIAQCSACYWSTLTITPSITT